MKGIIIEINEHLKTFLWAVWLGWQVEANWTNPLLFALYSIIKPISSCLILVVMYYVATSGKSGTDLFYFMFIGNTLFMFISGAMQGITMVLHIEREHYQTLKYVYLATSNLHIYLFGRSAAKIITSAVAVVITLLFGKYILHIPLSLSAIDFPLLFISSITGLIGIISFGLILAGISMFMAMHNFFFSQAVGAILYFLSGVLFPISVLPPYLRKISLVIPFTYWMEATRRTLLPQLSPDQVLANLSTSALLFIFTVTSLILMLTSLIIFRYMERITREKGTIDMTTAY